MPDWTGTGTETETESWPGAQLRNFMFWFTECFIYLFFLLLFRYNIVIWHISFASPPVHFCLLGPKGNERKQRHPKAAQINAK